VCGQRVGAALLQPCCLPCPHVLLAFNVPSAARLTGAWCQLVVKHLRRYAHSLKGDHDDHGWGYLFTLIAHKPLGLQGARGGPGLGSGNWSRMTRDDPRAALGYTVHVEVMDKRKRVIYMPRLLF
jgi:hypothetical protein